MINICLIMDSLIKTAGLIICVRVCVCARGGLVCKRVWQMTGSIQWDQFQCFLSPLTRHPFLS